VDARIGGKRDGVDEGDMGFSLVKEGSLTLVYLLVEVDSWGGAR
jgi:hypothetical protein